MIEHRASKCVDCMNRCRHCNRQEPSIIAEIYYICMLIKWDTTSMWDRVLYCHSVIECIVIIVELWIHSLLHCEYDESLSVSVSVSWCLQFLVADSNCRPFLGPCQERSSSLHLRIETSHRPFKPRKIYPRNPGKKISLLRLLGNERWFCGIEERIWGSSGIIVR